MSQPRANQVALHIIRKSHTQGEAWHEIHARLGDMAGRLFLGTLLHLAALPE